MSILTRVRYTAPLREKVAGETAVKASGGGSPWDVPGLAAEVGALLGGPTKSAAEARAARERPDARALVAASPKLSQDVERCQEALGSARATVREAFGTAQAKESPAVEAWLALMDEVLNFGEAMTGALLRQSA